MTPVMAFQSFAAYDATFEANLLCSIEAEDVCGLPVFGIARGSLLKSAAGPLAVHPLYIEDHKGRYSGWKEPSFLRPIPTLRPILHGVEAQVAFAAWASRTFEKKWMLALA